jgi:hypothetical protein
MTPKELLERWRQDAELLDGYGATQLATTCRRHADDLAAVLRSVEDDALDLAAAAQVSGYSPDRLRHLVASGAIANAGRKGSPRIRRGDLPIKRRGGAGGFDAAAVAGDLLSAARRTKAVA